MESKTNCKHEWIRQDNYLICSLCSAKKLFLVQMNKDILVGKRKDGKAYSVRINKKRYFYPYEWNLFMEQLNEKNKLLFEFLIGTGARIEEALSFSKDGLVDDERKTITLYVTKRKAKVKGEQMGKPRTFEVSTSLYNKLKRQSKQFPFINVDEVIQSGTEEGRNLLKKYTKSKKDLAYMNLRSNLKRAGINDYYNFGLHSIRKTHGMWLKTLGIDMTEITQRLGHDIETYNEHYGSPSVFNPKDRQEMIRILGDIYNLR